MDRNKTELTHRVTNAAFWWLDERGGKPVETEVSVEQGWVADLATVIVPTKTELVDLKLLKRRAKKQPYQEWWEMAQRVQESFGLLTVLVEVKTSRNDFVRDRKWKLPPATHLSYVAIPKELRLDDDELPEGWGVLEYSAVTDCVRCTVAPRLRRVKLEQQLNVVHEIAVRRDHHTRYERHRDLEKRLTAVRNEDISRTRVVTAMQAMRAIVRGEHGSVKDALGRYGIRHLPEYEMLGLGELWGRARVVD